MGWCALGYLLNAHPTVVGPEHEVSLNQLDLGSRRDAHRLSQRDLTHTVEQNGKDAFGGITEATDVTAIRYSLRAEIRENGASVVG